MTWFFRRQPRVTRERIDGGIVLDRMAVRLQHPIRGDARLILARELEQCLPSIASCASRPAAAMIAHREARRISAALNINSGLFSEALADELTRACDVDSVTA
jgi:hypothetical protein